jgi:acyl-CoA hydrolase
MWVDEFAWMTASLDFPGATIVTIGMDAISFKHRVENGAILRFIIKPSKKGTKSITYNVTVYSDEPGEHIEKKVFTTTVTFVSIGEDGKSQPLNFDKELRSERN